MSLIRRVLLVACLVVAGPAWAEVQTPTIEGPVTGGRGLPFLAATFFDLSKVGYSQTEWFIGGTATAFTSAAPLTPDGKWTATPNGTATYKTRIVVNRPTDPKRFNGTVVVEWMNVSGPLESAPDWISGHVELIRAGMAWVGVSAQQLAVEGGTSVLGSSFISVKAYDPARYASLVHPGDDFSYDIFSQAGAAARQPGAASPLGGLKVKRVIAAGESQSAFRMVTYVNAIHPLTRVFDGFMIHSRGASGADLASAPRVAAPRPTFIRDDVRAPVLMFETETDLIVLGYQTDRQPDTKRVRLWEVAGTSHVDTYTFGTGFTDVGDDSAVAGLVLTTAPVPGYADCTKPVNSGPHHWVLNAAFAALDRWVRHGKPPHRAPRLVLSDTPPIAVDAHGNAQGGIRTPAVDVPVATFSGLGNTGAVTCFIAGTTVPFDAATLHALYPTHDAFVGAYKKSLRRAVKLGFILKPDAKLILDWATASGIGG